MIIQSRGDVIKLKGALVENQWPAIRSAVSLLLESHPKGVIIDASGITEISDIGARTFLDAGNFIQSHNARVVVAGMPEDMQAEIRKIPGVRSQLVTSATVEEARASLEAGGVAPLPEQRRGPAVLVPLIGAWRRALDYAAVEASARRAEVQLLYVLQIPRNLPLGEPVPQMEQEAQQTLDDAEKALRRRGVRIRKLTTRARDAIDGATKFAAESKPELTIVAYLKSEMANEGGRYAVMSAFCTDTPGDLAVLCVS